MKIKKEKVQLVVNEDLISIVCQFNNILKIDPSAYVVIGTHFPTIIIIYKEETNIDHSER